MESLSIERNGKVFMNDKEGDSLLEDVCGLFQRNDPVLFCVSKGNKRKHPSKDSSTLAEMRTGYLPNTNLKTVLYCYYFHLASSRRKGTKTVHGKAAIKRWTERNPSL